MVKIIGVSGSPRKGATLRILEDAFSQLTQEGVETEIISLFGNKIAPCNGCGSCRKNKTWCVFKDDMQELLDTFVTADAVLIGSPVYVHSVTPQLMAFFSRLRPATVMLGSTVFRSKLGAAFSVGGTRNGGQESAVNTVLHLLMSKGFNIVSNEERGYIGGKVWSRDIKELSANDDESGYKTVFDLAGKLAETAYIFDAGKKVIAAQDGNEQP